MPAIALAIPLSAPAGAATVSQTIGLETGACEASQSCRLFRTTRLDAAPGEANDLVAHYAGRPATLRFAPRVAGRPGPPLEAGPGCVADADGSVACVFEQSADEVGLLRVALGDGKDWFRLANRSGNPPRSLAGRTTIEGGSGNDRLAGCGVLRGGAGDDRLRGSAGVDRLEGGAGRDSLGSEQGDDILRGGPGPDVVFGRSGDDELRGGPGNDRLEGGAGDDTLRGDGGRDRLNGGFGPDRLWGDAGADRLDGGLGPRRDALDGGAGYDRGRTGPGPDRLRAIERTLPPFRPPPPEVRTDDDVT